MNKKIMALKEQQVEEVKKTIDGSESTFVVEYRGLSVAKLFDLRRELRKEESDMKVFKNSIVERAVNDLGYSELKNELSGPNAFVFVKKNSALSAKILSKFARLNEDLVLKGSIVEKTVVSVDDVKTLSKLTTKEDMISKFLGCLKAPMSKFASTLDAVAKEKN